jgi:protein arginine kinase
VTVGALTASAMSLSRNDAGRRFCHVEEPAALEELRSEVLGAVKDGQWERPWRVYDLDSMSPVEITHLVERGLMTPAFSEGDGEGRGFAVYGNAQASLEINGVDHFSLIGFREGDKLDALWSLLSVLDDRLEAVTSYAFDPRWGYLTAYPAKAGTGLRVYATLHVPALMLTGKLASTALELVGRGLGIAPLWGGAGGVVQISNVARQTGPETEILAEVENMSRAIAEKERSVRKMLLREHPVQGRDQIGRALGVAQHAWTMSFQEAVNLISAAQVGLEQGLVDAPGLAAESAFSLMSRLQPAHIVLDHMDVKTDLMDSPEIDEIRARVMREVFAGSGIR